MDDRERLARYAPAVAVPLLNTDPVKWPIGSGRAGAVCTEELAAAIVDAATRLGSMPSGVVKAGREFGNPSRIWRMSHHLLRSMKATGVSKKTYQQVMLTLLRIAEKMKAGPLYNDAGYNIVLTEKERAAAWDAAQWIDGPTQIHRLAGLLWTYSEALYFVAHEIAVEIHGLYPIGEDRGLVRDYINLRPTDLWPDAPLLPWSEVSLICEYSPELDLYFDIYNNHYPVSGGFGPTLRRGAVRVDGRWLTEGEIDAAVEEATQGARQMVALVTSLAEAEQGKKYVEIFWYRLKPLLSVLGEDWRPPTEVLERIDRDGLPAAKPQRTAPPEVTYSLLDLL